MADPILQPEDHAHENRREIVDEKPTRAFDVVELPSQGKLYTEGPLKGRQFLDIHYLTAKEEDILTAPNLLKSGKIIDYLLKSVMVDKTIDPEQLLLGDRNTILVWLRSTGYGSEYPVGLTCKHCGTQFENEFDLASLDIRHLTVDPTEDGTFPVDLPVTKKRAHVRFLTAAQDSELDKIIETRSRKLKGSGNPMTLRLQSYVVEIEGMDEAEKRSFIETLPVRDSQAIRQFIRDNEPSVIMKQDAQCPHCGTVNEEVAVPITERFFWPDAV